MTGRLDGKYVAQVDELLIEGKLYSEAEIKSIIKEYESRVCKTKK